MNNTSITVVIPAYDFNKVGFLIDSINSVLKQNYDNFDILVITEGNKLTSHIESTYMDSERVSIVQIQNDKGGISVARNEGFKHAEGDIIAYIDSDAVADENWLHEINKSYNQNNNIISVGGKSKANWLSGKPWYLPEEFLWLVGVTHEGHASHGSIIRNTFGCNMSFKKDVLKSTNGFDMNLGKSHGFNLQGEEPDLGIRLYNKYNTGTYYNENAVVHHSVEEHQTKLSWLCKRAYLQGITKYMINNKYSDNSLGTENDYLSFLFLHQIPNYVYSIIHRDNIKESAGSIIGIFLFTFLVFIGYIRGFISI